jgi:hypothetical protein
VRGLGLEKLMATTVRVRVPGGTAVKVKMPLVSVVAVNRACAAGFSSVTLAPAMTAPLGSATVPVRVAGVRETGSEVVGGGVEGIEGTGAAGSAAAGVDGSGVGSWAWSNAGARRNKSAIADGRSPARVCLSGAEVGGILRGFPLEG